MNCRDLALVGTTASGTSASACDGSRLRPMVDPDGVAGAVVSPAGRLGVAL